MLFIADMHWAAWHSKSVNPWSAFSLLSVALARLSWFSATALFSAPISEVTINCFATFSLIPWPRSMISCSSIAETTVSSFALVSPWTTSLS